MNKKLKFTRNNSNTMFLDINYQLIVGTDEISLSNDFKKKYPPDIIFYIKKLYKKYYKINPKKLFLNDHTFLNSFNSNHKTAIPIREKYSNMEIIIDNSLATNQIMVGSDDGQKFLST